ncbi:PD-(D/E)XK nuclease family protein [Granulicella tundricola]|nr:PD-(D/E)XK nuclease family protein [Granulicella tundricola]
MQSVTTLPPVIAEAISRGVTILTPGQRAARTLRLAYDLHQRASGIPTWTPPEIHPLDSWLTTLWHRLTVTGQADRLLLNPTQEHVLWRQIITSDPEVSGLRSPDSLASMAASAWRTLCLHNGRTRLPGSATSTDTRAFERWAQTFQRLCLRQAYLSPAQLPELLTATVNLPIPPAGLLLLDFDTLLPAHQTLFDTLSPVAHHQTTTPAPPHLHAAADPRSELLTAANWIAQTLSANPESRIAVVVPDLESRRPEITRIFAQTLSPELQRFPTPATPTPFEFALGQPLSHTALAATALNLLTFTLSPLPLDTISTLLLSPYLITPIEQLAAAEFDAFTLRQTRLLRPELTLEALLALLPATLPSLSARLRALHRTAKSDLPTQQSHAAWSDTFRALLESAGWTRTAPLDSLAFQTHRRFSSALDELATLDFDGTHPTAAAALATFTRILDQTIFAPESHNAPIQILGPLEIGAVPFDALWFLSAGDLTWPNPPSTSPLIPWQLQRALNIPGSDPTQSQAAAQTLTTRIAHSASQVIFSYAVQVDEAHQRPSPSVTALKLTPLKALEAHTTLAPQPYDIIPDQTTLPPLPDVPLRGGATILQLQAACAFRAFAEQRLFSSEPQPRTLGLDPRDRGNLVHKVMEELWSCIHDQGELKALTLPARDSLLADCINHALQRTDRLAQSPWDEAYLGTQRTRLLTLLRPWLDLEAARPAFAVRAREQADRHAQLGPLTLSLRMDRVDETDAGLVILDYKTGVAAPSDWLSDRPDAPQLPLYAVLTDQPEEPVAGIAFAILRAGDDLCLKGYATGDDVFGKTSRMNFPTMEDQLEDWRRVLTQLATSFAEGDTAVLPKSYPKTCAYCAQRILCRLNPTTLTDLNDEEPEEAAIA